MWTVDRAALVFCIDQVEDLRFFDDAEERFQKAVRDLIQIANRVPNAIIIISCLEDFYGQVRGVLAQSYIDRIEKSGPVALLESRTPEEARLIIAKRLAHRGATPTAVRLSRPVRSSSARSSSRSSAACRPAACSSTRRAACAQDVDPKPTSPTSGEPGARTGGGFISHARRRARLRLGAPADDAALGQRRSTSASCGSASRMPRKPRCPPTMRELLDVLSAALGLAKDEWGGSVTVLDQAPRTRRRPARARPHA